MKQFIFICLLFTALMHSKAQNNKVKTIKSDLFLELTQTLDDILIVDIREYKYFKRNQISKAVYGGKKDVLQPILNGTSKDTPILIYCEEGKRSLQAGQWIISLGYKTVYQLEGGMNYWSKNNYPLINKK